MSALIVTARLNHAAQLIFDDLRARHFPPRRNLLSAHLTLFHALPSSELASIQADLAALAGKEAPMWARAARLRSLGNGVAFAIDCPRLVALRNILAEGWTRYLGRQDKQAFLPHITIQNKVPAATARQLLDDLQRTFTPIEITLEGLDLWEYLGGPWRSILGYSFENS